MVNEGASYVLTVADLAATDIDMGDGAAELTWTLVPGTDAANPEPANGHLELSTASGAAITSFTQAQLEAGEVVYVHDDSNTLSDVFTLQVADDGVPPLRADPVIVHIAITRKLDSIDLSEFTVADGFIIQGDAPGDRAGFSVSGAGDVNGDGYADLIVGAYRGDDGGGEGSDFGEAYVVFGKASGFGNADSAGRRFIDLESLAAEDGFIIQGDAPGDRAGFSVSGAGDVNGDGYADLIVGANEGDDGGNLAGEAYVVFGKQDDFGNDVSNTLDGGTMVVRRVVDLTNLAAGDGFIIQGDAERDNAGRSVSSAGDVNGDGFADLIVGANGGDDGGDNAGEAYVLFGKQDGFGSPMGRRQVIDLERLVPEDGFIIQGDAMFDSSGFSVSSAGDVNGDGFADLIVGALGGETDGGTFAGEAYVVFGKDDDFGDEVRITLDDGTLVDRRVVDLTNLAAGDGFIIQGDAVDDRAGVSVSAAGDVNGLMRARWCTCMITVIPSQTASRSKWRTTSGHQAAGPVTLAVTVTPFGDRPTGLTLSNEVTYIG